MARIVTGRSDDEMLVALVAPVRCQLHHQALRALGNRLVGILHGCLAHRVLCQEQIAWPAAQPAA